QSIRLFVPVYARTCHTTPTAPSELHPLPLHDALPILPIRFIPPMYGSRLQYANAEHSAPNSSAVRPSTSMRCQSRAPAATSSTRSEEHTSELQSRANLVCRPPVETNKRSG